MILLFVVNSVEFFLSHRLPLAVAANRVGFKIHIVSSSKNTCSKFIELGFDYHYIPLSRSGINPFDELRACWNLYRLMRKIKPDLVHLVTIKPVLYGGVIARLAGIPAMVAAISGLGSIFVAQNRKYLPIRRIVEWLYKLALGHSNLRVIFQNLDDRSELLRLKVLRHEQSVLIKGSGVLLDDYPILPEPDGVPVVTFASRLLKDKGVREFVQAAELLSGRGVSAKFWLAGSGDPGNLTTISEDELLRWKADGLVEVLGYRNDIPNVFAKSNIVVLPSYREGLPKVLIEAAACGRAVVTTNTPGCRDAIVPEISGLLVPIRDANALADAIEFLIENPVRRKEMGLSGRRIAESEYKLEKVIDCHLAIYQELTVNSPKE